jgi:RimJ/RimL family protein N-acetyltransferase
MEKIRLKNNLELVISKACVDDAESIIRFLNEIGGETDFLTFGLNEFPLSLVEEQKMISDGLNSNKFLIVVGKVDQKIVSQLFLDRSNNARLSHIGNLGVSVSKGYWRNSIGKHMILFSINWAKLSGITKLNLDVRTDHYHAINLYKKLGFHIEGQVTRAVKIDDVYFDNYQMGMEI